jgi:hypothetical protein
MERYDLSREELIGMALIEITTEDGVVVHEGDWVYDYYSMKPGLIVPGSITHMPDVWFDVAHDGGGQAMLNGQRICSIEYARRRGFKGA